MYAARWQGYRWLDFRELDGDQQAKLIAGYRIHNMTEAVVAHDQARAAERARKK